jgi:hypothetical protein
VNPAVVRWEKESSHTSTLGV